MVINYIWSITTNHSEVSKPPIVMTYHVSMWELDCEESWALKNWCFWAVVLEETPESPLDCKEIQPVHPKGDQSWVFIGRTDAEAETLILWPPDVKSWLIGKDPNAGRDRGQEEKGRTEDEMAGWHHRLNGREFEWTPGIGDGQGGLVHCDSWGRRVGHDWATELNWLIHLKVLLGMKESAHQSLKLSIRKPVLPAMAFLFSLLEAWKSYYF